MIPERSLAGKSAKSVFFEDMNDIDIFVEDTAYGYEKILSIIFSRVFSGKYRVNKTFPLGGRLNVIDHFRSHVSRSRPTLHVIDGDLFLLGGDTVENSHGLFKIPFYCIENLLCDNAAFCDFMNEEDAVKTRDELADAFRFNDWIDANCDLLFSLFVEYAVSFILNPAVQTVAYSVSNLVTSGFGDLDERKTNARIDSLAEQSIKVAGLEKYEEVKSNIVSEFNDNFMRKLDVVSGKDYIFPLLKMRLKSVVKTKVPDINLKLRLAMKCDVDKIMQASDYVVL